MRCNGSATSLVLTTAVLMAIAAQTANSARVTEAADEARRPNVVLIVADDLGVNDLSCYGRKDQPTPHLDALAASGMRFTSGYCGLSICSASRAALMTGKSPARLHLTTFLPGRADAASQKLLHPTIEQKLPLAELTIAERLKAIGYATACIGKWHLGGQGFGPAEQGFDVVYAGKANTTPSTDEGGKGEFDLTAAAEKFIDEHHQQPFLLYVPHNNPHVPLAAQAKRVEKHKNAFNPIYAAMIETLDESVGRIVARLAKHKQTERTLFVFTSDNGGLHILEFPHTPATHNTPFRAGKGYLYEGGLRVPLIMSWPGVIPAGRTVDAPVVNCDFTPTLLDICGLACPEGLDGQSVLNVLRGQPAAPRTLFWHFPHYTNQGSRPAGAVRHGDWKLIEHYEDGRRELFDLSRDPGESRDLAAEQPERTEQLATMLKSWRASVGAQENSPNPNFSPEKHREIYGDFDTSRVTPAATAEAMRPGLEKWRELMDAAVAKPAAAKQGAAKQGAAKPGAAKSGAAKPNASKPKPNADKPAEEKPASTPGSAIETAGTVQPPAAVKAAAAFQATAAVQASPAGPLASWPLSGDVADVGSRKLATAGEAVKFVDDAAAGWNHPVAQFNGRDSRIEVKSDERLRLGAGDFTVSLWVDAAVADDAPGDLVSLYDPAARRGFNLSLKSHAVTSSQANRRTLHFGIDQGRFEPKWTDHGRIGQAIMVFSLAVHDGKLYAGTCEPGKEQSGRVYRWDGGEKWTDCGAPGKCNSVSSLAVFEGKLYAGTAKYRLAGSALPESENPNLGGQVFRYDGENKWVPCGQLPETEGIGGMAVFQGRLYAGSLYRPAGFFRYEGGERWTPLETPNGKRVEALCVHNDQLFASTYDQAHIFRFDGTTWTDCGQVGDETNTQTYSFAVHYGRLYVGTWRSGKVFRYEADNRWTDCGRLGEELEVMGMLVHNGSLFAGSLPLAQVYRFNAPAGWTNVGQVDSTPMVTYRRAWTMTEFQGRLFVGTLPTGRVLSQSAGANVTYDHEFPAGWHHVAAVRAGGVLRLYVDGRQVAESASFRASDYDLSVDRPLTIGFGPNDYFRGKLHGVRLDARALSGEELGQLSRR